MNILAAIALAITVRRKDIVNPLVVFFGPIYLQYQLYFFLFADEYSLSGRTNEVLLAGVGAFFVGAAANFFIFNLDRLKRPSENVIESGVRKMIVARPIMLFLGVAGFFTGLYYAYNYGTSGPYSFFFNLRYAATVDGSGLGAAPYLLLFLQMWLLYSICVQPRVSRLKPFQIGLILILLLVSSLFTMARTGLFFTLISSAGVYYLSRRYLYKMNVKGFSSIVLFIGVLFGAFVLVAVLTKKTEISDVFDSFLAYLAMPIVAFDKFIVSNPGIHNGHNILYPVAKIGELFGLMTPWHKVIPGVSSTDFNAFTYLNAPYLDFGLNGVIGVSLLMGLVISFIYESAKKGKPFHIVLYSLLLFPQFMAFYEYQFSLVSWIYYLAILVGTYLLVPKKQNVFIGPGSSVTGGSSAFNHARGIRR